MMDDNFKHSEITNRIIKAFYKVYNKLGYGFLEKVYENAMVIELQKMGLQVSQQMPVEVFYNEMKVGLYFSDLLVNDLIIVELKAAESLCEENEY